MVCVCCMDAIDPKSEPNISPAQPARVPIHDGALVNILFIQSPPHTQTLYRNNIGRVATAAAAAK